MLLAGGHSRVNPYRPSKGGVPIMNAIWKLLASLRLTVVLLLLATVLVFLGTLAQVHEGLYDAQVRWFKSFVVTRRAGDVWWVLPVFPGGYTLGFALLFNLLAAHLQRFKLEWSKAAKIGKIPVRFIATVDYQHDFTADSRRATSRLDGFDTPVSSGPSRRRRDAIKVGGAIEGQIGDGKTMRIYGEQEMGGGGSKVTRFGVSFGIEF